MEVNLTRRGFLTGAAALAGICATSGAHALQPAIRSGIIEDQTFILDEPLVISGKDITIRNCIFISRRKGAMLSLQDVDGVRIYNCEFVGQGGPNTHPGAVNPQTSRISIGGRS